MRKKEQILNDYIIDVSGTSENLQKNQKLLLEILLDIRDFLGQISALRQNKEDLKESQSKE